MIDYFFAENNRLTGGCEKEQSYCGNYVLGTPNVFLELDNTYESDEMIATKYMGYTKVSKKRMVNGVEREVGAWYEDGHYVFDCKSPYYCADKNLEFSPTTNWNHTQLLIDKFVNKWADFAEFETPPGWKNTGTNYSERVIFGVSFKERTTAENFCLEFCGIHYRCPSKELLYCFVMLASWDCEIQEIEYVEVPDESGGFYQYPINVDHDMYEIERKKTFDFHPCHDPL